MFTFMFYISYYIIIISLKNIVSRKMLLDVFMFHVFMEERYIVIVIKQQIADSKIRYFYYSSSQEGSLKTLKSIF